MSAERGAREATQGRWYAKQTTLQCADLATTVAHCNGDWYVFADTEHHGDPEATARLLAAAPAMRDALADLLDVLAASSAVRTGDYYHERKAARAALSATRTAEQEGGR